MPRVTQAMLERGLGGPSVLVQLSDKTGSGVADPTFVSEVLAAAEDEANSMIMLAVDLADPGLATASLLLRHQTAIAVYLAWLRGAGGQAVPAEVRAAFEEAERVLTLVGERRRGLGLPVRPTGGQIVEQVTKDDTEEYFAPKGPRRRFDGWS
jgi:hypothetical protein